MMKSLQNFQLIIGVGNEYRSDDSVGLRVARRLKELAGDQVVVLEQSGEGTALLEAWKGAEAVFLIDAIRSGAEAGTIRRLDARAQPVPAGFFHCSTHAFGVAEAIELGRALNQLAPRQILYGIEGKNFETGNELSGEVELAAREVAARVIHELQAINNSRI